VSEYGEHFLGLFKFDVLCFKEGKSSISLALTERTPTMTIVFPAISALGTISSALPIFFT
jgi:hypothetical protein